MEGDGAVCTKIIFFIFVFYFCILFLYLGACPSCLSKTEQEEIDSDEI